MKRFLLVLLLLCCAFCLAENEDQLILPDNITVIEEATFENCSSVTAVTVPLGVKTIAKGAFSKCTNLSDVYFHGTREEWEAIDIQDDNKPLTAALLHCKEPLMYLTSIPAYGEGKHVEGYVRMGDGSAIDPGQYHVRAYICVDGNWWIKPTYATSFVTLDKNGCFSLQYDTGGENDRKCTQIRLLLLPTSNDETNIYDEIMITRTTDGAVTCEPNRNIDEPYEYHNKPIDLSVSSDKIMLDVGLFLNGEPSGAVLTEDTIRARLQTIQPYCNVVRFYSATGTTYERAYKVANEMGFTVIGSAWLQGDEASDQAEVDALIELCNNGKCAMACVGSEVLLRNQLSVSEVVSYIDYVRERIPDTIPVTCADSIGIIQGSARLQAACDVFFVNCYAYYGGVTIDNAMTAFTNSVDALRSCDTTKQLIISETGWPSAGSTYDQAVPSEENAAKHFDDIHAWSVKNNIAVCYFEAFDEKWKASADSNVERHWGIWDGNTDLKSGFESSDFFK